MSEELDKVWCQIRSLTERCTELEKRVSFLEDPDAGTVELPELGWGNEFGAGEFGGTDGQEYEGDTDMGDTGP
jgi:hypothetical protein